MKNEYSLEEAQKLLIAKQQFVGKEKLNLLDALGRVISENIKARENIPPFNRSPLDGYAFRAKDTENAEENKPVLLEIIDEIQAGYVAKKQVVSGTAIKIMTGAPIPEGADAVIKFEEIEKEGSKIKIFSPFKSGQNIIMAGEDVAIGEVIANQGTVITPPLIGLLASLGISKVPIFKRPQVAIVNTGDELVDINQSLTPGKIRNSNGYSLQAYCRENGADPVIIGTAKDKKEEVAELISQGLLKGDIVLTTGGASVGDYDVVQDAVQYLGAELLFNRIDIKPGSPTLAAVKDGKVILALSGNPASALIVFQLLGIPLIKKIAGHNVYHLEKIDVILKDQFRKASPKRRFLRGKLIIEQGLAMVKLTGAQGNAILRSMLGCNVLVEVPAGSGPLKKGEIVTAHLVDKINRTGK